MTTRAAAQQDTSLPRKLTAFLIWLVGLGTTYLAVVQLEVPPEVAIYTAIIVQAGLTAAQSALWRGKLTMPAIIAVLIDGAINFSGLYPYLRNVDQLDGYQALVVDGILPEALPTVWVAVGCYAICCLIAGLPELTWRN